MQRKTKLQSLWPVLVAYFTAVNHYTLLTISQPIFNRRETANCSHKSQSELLLQVRFPQMPSQAQLLHNGAETGGFILRMNLNKWIKFQRLWQIPAIWHQGVRDGQPSLGSSNTRAGSCLFSLWLVQRAAAMADCDKCGTSAPSGHSPPDGAAAPGTSGTAGTAGLSCHCCHGHCGHCWHTFADGCAAVSGEKGSTCFLACPRTGFPPHSAKRSQPHTQMLACGTSCFDNSSMDSVAAHNLSPSSPHCLSQYSACNVK